MSESKWWTALCLVLAVSGFVIVMNSYQPQTTTEALQDAGYTNIVIDGRAYFSCGSDDFLSTRWYANSPGTGIRVRGAFCSGLFFKGGTIRTEGRVK